MGTVNFKFKINEAVLMPSHESLGAIFFNERVIVKGRTYEENWYQGKIVSKIYYCLCFPYQKEAFYKDEHEIEKIK